jgi:hypothetical protein
MAAHRKLDRRPVYFVGPNFVNCVMAESIPWHWPNGFLQNLPLALSTFDLRGEEVAGVSSHERVGGHPIRFRQYVNQATRVLL